VAAQVGGVEGDDDFVSRAGEDLVVAPRAAVRLGGLVGLDVTHLDRPACRLWAIARHFSRLLATRTGTTCPYLPPVTALRHPRRQLCPDWRRLAPLLVKRVAVAAVMKTQETRLAGGTY
jgi:hypothetical protein